MRTFKSFEAVEEYLLAELKDCLYNEIGDEIDHTVQKQIETDVYGAYNPKVYKRRGLLKSAGSLYHIPNGLSLTVVDQTPGDTPIWNGYRPTGTDLSVIISNASYGPLSGKIPPRPYLGNAEKEVKGKVGQILRRRFK